MHYCGLDVQVKSTHVYIEDERSRRVKRTVVPTTPVADAPGQAERSCGLRAANAGVARTAGGEF
jgi:hypothetical protein